MPVYEYGCKECGNTFEQIHKIDERATPLSEPCPECEGIDSVEHILSVAAFVSNHKSALQRAGSGWAEVLKAKKKGAGRRNLIKD